MEHFLKDPLPFCPLPPKDPELLPLNNFARAQKGLTKSVRVSASVQIYRNKEMAAVYEMLPYVRLAHVVEEEALEDVIFAKGPICPVSRSSIFQTRPNVYIF